jgi:hypothetical protein
VPPALEEAIRYLETRQDWVGNYERGQGYHDGSGRVERAVALVINVRMKKGAGAGNALMPPQSCLFR